VHQLTDSSIRATVLSAKSLVEKTFFAIITPFIGWVVDVYTLAQALTLSGVLVLFFGAICLVFILKNDNTGMIDSNI
jgi:uncharacterized membrane protein